MDSTVIIIRTASRTFNVISSDSNDRERVSEQMLHTHGLRATPKPN